MRSIFKSTALAISLMMAPAALAQDPASSPGFGAVTLAAGFDEDPTSFAVRAGGAIASYRLDSACAGFITYQPTVTLDYTSGPFELFISAISDSDVTLTIHTPGGNWLCNDDAQGLNLNAGVTFETPQSGQYSIWVGTSSAGVGYPASMLHISEAGYATDNELSRPPLPRSHPSAGSLTLSTNSSEPTQSLIGQAGGDIDGRNATTGQCWGFITQEPTFWLNYSGRGRNGLFISMEAVEDTTLIVLQPNGEWICDDDTAGNLNPGIHLDSPGGGRYAIWAASYSEASPVEVEFFASEVGFSGLEDVRPSLSPTGTPNYGELSLESGFEDDPHSLIVAAGGPNDVYEAIGMECRGFTSSVPDYNLNYIAGDTNLFISAMSHADTTLVIRQPNGNWVCDDDSAGRSNAGIHIETPQSGTYNIYVGTYNEGRLEEATLFISEADWGEGYLSFMSLDTELPPVFGEVELAGDFTPDPLVLEMTAGGNELASEVGCVGHFSAPPSFKLSFSAGDLGLFFSVISDADTTMAINDPSGEWVCNDDNDGTNPGIKFESPEDGVYDVWVGTYNAEELAEATLYISEIGYTRADQHDQEH